jgi:hypothetical protein
LQKFFIIDIPCNLLFSKIPNHRLLFLFLSIFRFSPISVSSYRPFHTFYSRCKNRSFCAIFSAPLCPAPPQPPPSGGTVVNNPLVIPLVAEESCVLTGTSLSLQCHSFLSIYIQASVAGRVQASPYSTYCVKSNPLLAGCTNTSVATQLRTACHGQVFRFAYFRQKKLTS